MRAPADHASGRVLVLDEVAHFQAYAPAEALADAGAEVNILTPKLFVGGGLDQATMMTMLRRLAGKGVAMVANSAVMAIADGAVQVRDTLSAVERSEPADLVVAAVGNRAVDSLARELAALPAAPEIHVVGDAAAPRSILEAIREGRSAGRSV